MESDRDIERLFDAGRPRGLARAISRAESGRGAGLVHRYAERAGRAVTIGLTGPPGVGKSTLSNALITKARGEGKRVGVISVDPSSPFSKGAILGDRIRLSDHFVDEGVFIRSMASRGHLGGLAGATGDAVALMDAFGLDVIVIETVGVGQSEVEIADLADTTLVALQPGSGDSVQLLKAGILEVADVFVVNKADHPMALQLQREIRSMMEMIDYHQGWEPQLVSTQAREGLGIDELWQAIAQHGTWLRETGSLAAKRRGALAHRARGIVLGALAERVEAALAARLDAGVVPDPYELAQAVLGDVGSSGEAATGEASHEPAAAR